MNIFFNKILPLDAVFDFGELHGHSTFAKENQEFKKK